MGILHPLSDDYDALRGTALSPERTPPSSPPPPPEDVLEHQVSRMDTLAGIAIKYGVEISDIKRANSLVSDSHMFAHKTLLIPLPGKGANSSSNASEAHRQTKKRHEQSMESSSSPKQSGTSPAMSTLQSYYGLITTTPETETMEHRSRSTEMCVYHKQGQSASTKPKQDGSMRRRQKGEPADHHHVLSNATTTSTSSHDDFLADPIKVIKSLLPRRPISSIGLLNMDALGNGFRKSPSTPSFADGENAAWSIRNHHESFITRPLLDAASLPKPARRTKTATD